MKKIALLLSLSLSSFFAHAQGWALQYIDGKPVQTVKNADVEGSEMLYADWLKSTVKTQDGVELKNVMLKYNALDDVPYFLGKDDVTMLFTKPVFQFSIDDGANQAVFRGGFPAVGSFNEKSFYQVLTEGKAVLLKKIFKKVLETREYNSATTVKKITDNTAYFLFFEDKMISLKKDKSFFINNLGKKEQMQQFFANEKINLKEDDGLVKVINKFNSLH